MAKYSPQTKWYEIISNLKNIDGILYYIIFILSIAVPLIETIDWLSTIVKIILVLSIVFSSFIRYAIEFYFFPRAEEVKRNDFFDNSFDKKYNTTSSDGYFTNEELEKGIYKLLVNLFENTFFTYEISNKMKMKKILKFFPYVLVLVLISFWGFENNIFAIPFLQLFLSVNIIGDLLTLFVFSNRNEKIFDELKRLFVRMNGKDLTNENMPDIINLYSSYEANINWASIQLDSKIFQKINEEISNEWKEIKLRYKIGEV